MPPSRPRSRPRSKGITIYDVADAAGVSIATVSHVLNKPDRVSERTRRTVLEVVERLGYVPSAAAASRARDTVGRVGVLAPFTSYESYMRRLKGLLQVCADEHVEVCVYDRESALASSPLLESLPLNRRLDGLVIMGLSMQPEVATKVRESSLPVVMVDYPTREFSSIDVDDHEGGTIAAQHLLGLGHDQFLLLRESAREMDVELPGHRRMNGFLDALSAAGVPGSAVHTCRSENGIQPARDTVRDHLGAMSGRVAVFAHDDELAVGALAAARDLGRAVPDHVAVVGYDDGALAEAADLTTVRQPFEESGAAAAHEVLDILRGRTGPRRLVLPLTLVRRAST